MHIHSHALVTYTKNQPQLITLTNIRGLHCNIDSIHQFLLIWTLALFLTETQISLTDTTTFTLEIVAFPSFGPKAGVFAFVRRSPAPAVYQTLTFPITK